MIKKLKSIILIMTLAGCTVAPDQQKCPQLPINTSQPDYMQTYDYETLKQLYSCTRANVVLDGNTNAFGLVDSHPYQSDPFYRMRLAALDYQWNLWDQLYARRLSHSQAQAAWAAFNNQQLAEWQQIQKEEEAEQEAEAEQQAEWDEEAAEAADTPDTTVHASNKRNHYSDPGAGKGHGNGVECTSQGACKSSSW